MAMRLFAALLLLRRFAADARAPGAPPPGICEIKDQAAEWRRTPLYGKYKRLDVFVSGIEGAGHHGVVNGFLAPVVQLVTVAHRTDCDDRTEMPFFGHPPARQGRRCALYALYGWERDRGVPSYPSERRLHPPDRLAALYLKSCFPGGYPPAWKGYGLDRRGDLKRCWRCGTWQATLDDAYARLLRSDRLDVSALVKGVTGMRVLVLWRDFTSCVFSHGLFDGNAHAHAVLLAAHAASMARDAAAMDPNDWRLAEQDSPARRAVRAVFAYFSHTWAVFDEPAQQLIPNDFRAAANATRAAAAPPAPSNGDACPPPEVPRVVPWADWAEWVWVCEALHGSDAPSVAAGVARVASWQLRGGVPHAVESSAALAAAAFGPGDRLASSMLVVRCVNGLVDAGQTRQQAVSVAALAEQRGLPGWLVDVRHAATHNALPSARVLGSARAALAAYFYDEYWAPQRRKLDALRRRADALIDACLEEKRRRGGGLPKKLADDLASFPPATLGHALVPALLDHPRLLSGDRKAAAPLLRAAGALWPPLDGALAAGLAGRADRGPRAARAADVWLPLLLSRKWRGVGEADDLPAALAAAAVDLDGLWRRAVAADAPALAAAVVEVAP
ncbi:hypothetical protein AURANDRAFT_68377 [Aureococcus anophagefferens]|uniref:Uncharacterized protein n=1 Tax=Aureococcus anophagefferens TaxID=44056 RepID=F0YPF3_AURAN|nr:hypothetical protein AURANDRAFT_68377 [Aureococcus anophagefferens]EGB03007.1 hypothetical protein AURANDRAFT_68377 [Aureococcus anophagefferens]|eukprot:XP_009042297.1 hypothetical protein AURANDRAFT_68377 [Aureococcus anophagefferens]